MKKIVSCLLRSQQQLSNLQANLCQKHLFLEQLTHNMAKDCSLIYQFSTWKLQAQNMRRTCCVHKLFWMSKQKQKTICVHNMFSPCSELVVFMYWTGKSTNNLLYSIVANFGTHPLIREIHENSKFVVGSGEQLKISLAIE